MPVNLSIKEVPDVLANRLRARAERHHRSLQGELMAIIEQATAGEDEPRGAPQRQAGATVFSGGTKTIEQTAAALLLRFPEPISGGPMAVDIIRADRDSR